MTTVAGFDIDELAAKIILRAIISQVGGGPLIVDIDDPPTVRRPPPGDALAQLDEQRERYGMQVVYPVRD